MVRLELWQALTPSNATAFQPFTKAFRANPPATKAPRTHSALLRQLVATEANGTHVDLLLIPE